MRPIIASRLDNDFYNFTMGKLAWAHFPNTEVTYQLTNRSNFDLTSIDISWLIAEIERVRRTRFSSEDLMYLKSLGVFSTRYLNYLLREHYLPPVKVEIFDGELSLSYTGKWADAIFWETPLLAILSELGMNVKTRTEIDTFSTDDFSDRLDAKVSLCNQNPGLKFMEFGTRRRRSFQTQRQVIRFFTTWASESILGTSNVHLAREFGIKPLGTVAHQWFMVNAALLNNSVEYSTKRALNLFEQMYRDFPELLTYLPDTYGTDVGLKLFGSERAQNWSAVRQDSGEPTEIIEKILDWYADNNVDSKTKTIIPSDGLDFDTALSLYNQFQSRCKMVFGIGTNLTNDVGLEPISMVIKPVSVNDSYGCVKLSDNPDKASGENYLVRSIRQQVDRLAPVG